MEEWLNTERSLQQRMVEQEAFVCDLKPKIQKL